MLGRTLAPYCLFLGHSQTEYTFYTATFNKTMDKADLHFALIPVSPWQVINSLVKWLLSVLLVLFLLLAIQPEGAVSSLCVHHKLMVHIRPCSLCTHVHSPACSRVMGMIKCSLYVITQGSVYLIGWKSCEKKN